MLEIEGLTLCRGGRAVTIGVALVLLVALSSPIAAQVPQEQNKTVPQTHDFVGAPLSDNLVTGELYLKSGEVVQFFARDGTVVQVENEDYHYAFTSKVADDGQILFTMYDIAKVPGVPGAEAATQVGTGTALGLGQFAMGDMPLDIQVLNVGPANFESVFFDGTQPMNPGVVRHLAEKSGSCCVLACDGTIVCGCSVSTGCSACCGGSCCGGVSGPLEKQGLLGAP